MEQYGFARSKIAGEYAPYCSYVTLQADTTKSGTTFSTLLTTYITVDGPNDSVVIHFDICGTNDGVSGNTPAWQVLVDGVSQITRRGITQQGSADWSVRQYVVVSGLDAGEHKVEWQWRAANANSIFCKPVTVAQDHAVLFVTRAQALSDREMSGVALASWPAFYAPNIYYERPLTGAVSDTNTTPVTLLRSTTFQTKQSSSAILIRLHACGSTTNAVGSSLNDSTKFAVYVDGNVARGTCVAPLDGTASGRWMASMFCIVPTQAGIHQISVYWGGGAKTGTMNPTGSPQEGIDLMLEEVFCEDVTPVTDMEGFATSAFKAQNVSNVRFCQITADTSGAASPGFGTVLTLDPPLYVTGDNSLMLFDLSSSWAPTSTGTSVTIRLIVDGQEIRRTHSNAFSGAGLGGEQASVTYLAELTPGIHTVRIDAQGDTSFVYGATHPEYTHMSLMTREISKSGAYMKQRQLNA